LSNFNVVIVVLPTYNEADNIENIVKALLDLRLSVLVVDDNSPDNTRELVEKIMEYRSNLYLLNRNDKFGLGSAYRDGFKYAIGLGFKYFVQMDADYSHTILDLKKLLLKREYHDVIIGSRYVEGGNTKGWSLYRKYLSKYANLLSKYLIKTKIKDVTSGFRIYSLKALDKINYLETNSNGYGFQIEMTYLISKLNLNYFEMPITFEERREGESKMDFTIILEAFTLIFKLRFKN
jgi:dolichol-phosphate mannosyltransferase